MRLFILECKRILKTRRSLVLGLFMLAFTLFMAYMPTTYLVSLTPDEERLTGLDALAYDKEIQQGIAGIVTPEKVQNGLETFQSVYARYGADTSFDLPDAAYAEVNAVQPILSGLGDIFPDENGQPTSWLEIDPALVNDYYEAIPTRIQSLLDMQYPNDPTAGEYFVHLYDAVDTPFTYEPGLDSTTLDYLMLLAMVLLLCCALTAAPIFTSDYQSGADDIQRCTRHGRRRLGAVRLAAVLSICGLACAFCFALYWICSNSLYGWELLDTSAQMIVLFGPTAPLPFNYGQLQIVLSLLALLTILATVCTILLLSSRIKNLVAVTFAALALCILPIIVYMIAPSGIVDWLLTLLPSSGVALQTSTLYALRDFHLLNIGSIHCWVPIAMSIANAIELVLFAILALASYVRRHA